jgi:hypothetical protein
MYSHKLRFKMIGNNNTLKVYGIFFKGGSIQKEIKEDGKTELIEELKDWLTLKDASKIFNPQMSKDARNERVVQYNFKKFKNQNWLDTRKEKRVKIKKSKFGKITKEYYFVETYRANYNVFFNSKIETELKKFLIFFLEKSRAYLSDTFPEGIPSGIEEVIKQLFLTSIILKKNKIKGSFNLSGITLENYREKIQNEINQYYLERMNSEKKGKAYNKGLKELYPERAFWYFLNLFAFVMIKIFFNKNFRIEITKTSPEIYFWLCKLYGDDFNFYL